MSNNIAEKLSNTLHISSERAIKLLNLAEGNFNKARQLFIENLCAVKGHIICNDQKLYGVILIVFNEASNSQKVNMLNFLLSREKEILSLNLDANYNQFKNNFFNISFKIQLLTNLMNEINASLNKLIPKVDTKKIYTQGNVSEIKVILNDIIRKIVQDKSVDIQLDYELLSYIDFHIPEEKTEKTKTHYEDYSTTNTNTTQVMKTVKCDYKLSPAKGKPGKNLSVGDILFVKINDTSDDALKIINFLKQRYEGKVPDLKLPIINIEKNETDRLNVYVQLSENIRGKLLIGQEVNVKVYDPKSEMANKMKENSDSLFSMTTIFYLVIGLLAIFIIYILVFS